MFTIILLHGTASLTEDEYKKFSKSGIIIGGKFNTEEIARFVSEDLPDALDMLKNYQNTCVKHGSLYDVSEYALLYRSADRNNEKMAKTDKPTEKEQT